MDMNADIADKSDILSSAPVEQNAQVEHCVIENLIGILIVLKQRFCSMCSLLLTMTVNFSLCSFISSFYLGRTS